jgi:hypothetical protein
LIVKVTLFCSVEVGRAREEHARARTVRTDALNMVNVCSELC